MSSSHQLVYYCVVYFGRGKINPILILNNYSYIIHCKDQKKTRWRCKRRTSSLKCASYLYTTRNIVYTFNEHNHPCETINKENLISQQVIIMQGQQKIGNKVIPD
uniref:Uncharacterized protein LOC114346432 n=1 Tax=Diabrotica virgifera virgifera TaxID=50390 RepID=A0A6P7H5J4_DIAVI